MNTRTIRGTYGSGRTYTDIFIMDLSTGGSWYVCDGGTVVNFTYDEIPEGVNVETLKEKFANKELLEALKGLYEQCTMVHKYWGDGSNQKQADEAIKAGTAAIAKAEGRAQS